tara:strand:- start:52 stop:720 length:669 start_codon:yes stop_codon:yes gene_type:complete
MNNLTLIIPAKDEKDSLPLVLEEINSLNLNAKIVLKENDEETINAIKKYNHDILYQPNKGYGDALIHGINQCKTDYYCIFNADGSFDPKEIKLMYEELVNRNHDIIFGSRYQKNSGSDDDTIVTFIGNYIFTYIGKIFFSLPINDILYTFVIGKTKETQNLNLKQKDFSFCVELPIKAKKNNLNISSYPCYERTRIAGKKKVNAIKDGILILIHMIKLFFSK